MKLFGSSGIRDIFSKELLDIAFRTGVGVGQTCANAVVGTDTRTSGDAMKHAVISGVLASGARCSDAGIVSTPTLAYVTREFNAGIMVTASHNPPEYNGVKLFNPDGSSYDLVQQAQIEKSIKARSFTAAKWEDIKHSETYRGAIENHIKAIAAHFPEKIKAKVVVDAGCGAASEVTPRLLEKLGCEVVPVNCYNSGFFPRVIEPAEANLQELCHAVKDSGAQVGIAHDGDADRMMAVDENGKYITGDVMLALFAKALGVKEVVTTLDASMAIEEMGFETRRTKIGDTWVSEELKKGGAFGGETSGAWIFPEISLCPDGIYAAAQVASMAAAHKLSELAAVVPVYPLMRGSVNCKGLVKSKLKVRLMALKPANISNSDGFRLAFGDGWLLVRPSGTEPKIRLTAEAKTVAMARQLYEAGLKAVEETSHIGGKAS
ncbi:MAG TPA: phosphoglucosamine mutase [Dehalococcoidales bacterium]|nr:phosphoglucosamine mutase [Dehalococcoidales bacterium]